ncbi:hypothetical protein [uncultured Winogradskyella sp.]|uniref:hypothetical protein n=1 Tax=uncultured Winogradskyella sp. TaxID=395353 RepID=UPI0026346333|nr:hypothetical protein [uncultured Winogradskyella sp.]
MKIFKTPLLLLLFLIISQLSFAQDKAPKYSDIVVENPEPEADIKVVSNYVNALINNKMMEAKELLSDNYIGYGPAANDSITKQATLDSWNETHKIRSNEKVSFVTATIRVVQGEYKGDWVYQFGTYSFTQDGKDIELPYQFTALVNNGKIERSSIYYDNLAILKALGYQIIPPSKE